MTPGSDASNLVKSRFDQVVSQARVGLGAGGGTAHRQAERIFLAPFTGEAAATARTSPFSSTRIQPLEWPGRFTPAHPTSLILEFAMP